MIEQASAETRKWVAEQLKNSAIVLAVIVAAQVVALEVVLRGWQGRNAVPVFAGIVASALLCALAVIIFVRARHKKAPG
jgi:hypothetical protein